MTTFRLPRSVEIRRVKLRAAVLSLVALTACTYDASFRSCAVACAADGTCPAGLACGPDGLCHSPGVTCPAGADAGGTDAGDATGSAEPPSCAGLAATCGPDGSDDCCSIATPIPGGTFYRSYDVGSDGMYPDMSYPATVSPFRLDKYEVTVGRFRQFVAAGLGTQASPPAAGAGARHLNGSDDQGGWDPSWDADLATDTAALGSALQCDPTYQTWTATPGSGETLPINCVTWYEAFAFCAWDDGYLPTEAEWNFAAAGGTEQRAYSWSSPPGALTIDCEHANYYVDTPSGTYCVAGTTGGVNPVGSESPKGDGSYGQSDLEGNVAEWTLDSFQATYHDPCVDCASIGSAADRTLRGDGFLGDASALRTAVRDPKEPSKRAGDIGFRCAR